MKKREFIMNQLKTHGELNISLLGYYDFLIGMDWLEKHTIMLNWYDTNFTCLYNKGNTIIVKGIPRKVTIWEIYSLQMKMYVRKGCKFFAIYVMEDKYNYNQLKIEDIPI